MVTLRPLLLGAALLASCTGPQAPLEVKTFRMLDTKMDTTIDPMVRGEKQRRLHGAVSVAEQQERLGAYYTAVWHDSAGAGRGEVEVLLEYQQGATASKVLRQSRKFPAASTTGRADFAVTGANYQKNGRVLAWQITLSRGGRVLASERSHMWRKPSTVFSPNAKPVIPPPILSAPSSPPPVSALPEAETPAR